VREQRKYTYRKENCGGLICWGWWWCCEWVSAGGLIEEGVRIWNSGGKNPLLLLLIISPYEEILFLAAGRASFNYVFMLHTSGKRRVG
jgi:hypothetical protein